MAFFALTFSSTSILIIVGAYVIGTLCISAPSLILWVDIEEGRRRKRLREIEKGRYPSETTIAQVISTWDLIEHPTYLSYVFEVGGEANVIMDNTEPHLPCVIKFDL